MQSGAASSEIAKQFLPACNRVLKKKKQNKNSDERSSKCLRRIMRRKSEDEAQNRQVVITYIDAVRVCITVHVDSQVKCADLVRHSTQTAHKIYPNCAWTAGVLTTLRH